MSFDNKHYPNRKDHRKQYHPGSGPSVSKKCRPHGGDPIFEGNRLIRATKNRLIAEDELKHLNFEKEPFMEGIGGA